MLLLLLLAVLLGLIIGLLIYARWNYGVLEKLGITVVDKPHLFLGNTHNMYEKAGGLADIEMFKKHGPVYGVYEGRSPQVHICDAELIRLVTTKDAEYFNDKRRLDFRDRMLNEMPDFQPYHKWKEIRGFLTPVFSPAKIKLMSVPMSDTMDDFSKDLTNIIGSAPGKMLEKYDLRSGIFDMITDMIARCCFSVKVDNPTDPGNMFANIVRGLMNTSVDLSPMLETWSYSFPFLPKLLSSAFVFDPKKCYQFREIFMQMMQARRESGENKRDVVDLCIDLFEKVKTPEYKRLGITEGTIICQAFVFFFAGQDQISTLSAAMYYYVLQNPDIEKRLYDEVDSFMKRHKGRVEHDNLQELPYLMACLTETSRFLPFFHRTERVCTKDWKNEEFKLEIKKGMTVIIAIWAANRNPKYFPDPEKFDPERFLSPNKEQLHPYAYSSFGHGPRNCPGQKFSFETLMIVNAKLIGNFKFHLRKDSKPIHIPAGPFFSPHLPFYFDAIVRTKQ